MNRKGSLGAYVFLGFGAFLAGFPILWLVVSSLKPQSQFANPVPSLGSLTFENYVVAFTESDVGRWALNSLLIAVSTTILGLFICSMAAFSFARYQFRGKGVLFAAIVATVAFPDYITLIPVFVIERELHLLNTTAAVVLPLAAHALGVFLMRQYIAQLPGELFDAFRIDGSNEWRAYWSLAMPLVRPGLGATGLVIFLAAWNAYLLPLVVLRSPQRFTMPLGLAATHSQLLTGNQSIDPWAILTVGSVVSIVPLAACLIVMQRNFISGLTTGAVKA